ncbi:hypothetical protein [Subtercola boreus]|uniref:Peptidase M10 metallopeptidase domain-containing protein n=1 Tax=Subtercola boreus TaxID=120213 RepID=A0A3E0WAE7_9MICO|nr:hypothetical protein [Subtercola boreus]RFA18770.1 hypothetical protein B7R24_13565 [Subtercola boreus]RFA18887.1 hypothetical protein B7R23_13555 [Subtercola boreus]RFA25422.1 hypothetical protein B7R25_13665 [Subtercola boreus]
MSSRSSRRLALASVCILVALVASPVAAHAGGVAEGDCRLGDTQFLEGEPGSPQSQSQLCGGNFRWGTEASWYWTDEKLVIVEPRAGQFDYSAFSALNPFTGDGYSLRKANELFPDTSRVADAAAKLHYAEAALSAKARTLDARRGLKATDGCNFVPTLFLDSDIADMDSSGWLPPQPRPDAETGTYTYTFASNVTAEQKSAVLAGLVAFAAAREGSRQPALVEWKSGDAKAPVITFQNVPGGFEEGNDRTAEAEIVTGDKGRAGLTRWVSGNLNLSPTPGSLSAWTIMHEILHVYGFDHTSFDSEVDSEVMSPAGSWPVEFNGWEIGKDPTPAMHGGADECTKEGIQNAAPPK